MQWRLILASLLVSFSVGSFAAIDNQPGQSAKTAIQAAEAEAEKPPVFSVAGPDKNSQSAAGNGIVAADPLAVVGGLLLVVMLIIGIAWIMRRLGGLPAINGQSMKVIAALSVGTREKVVLIDVAGNQILLGVAPGRVSCIQRFEQPVVDSKAGTGSEFSKTIKNLLKDRSGVAHSSSEPKT